MYTFAASQYMPEVEGGFVSRAVHPENPDIVILNYTQACVYDRHWNDVTLACRGLIVNEVTGQVLARPFRKFFNYGEDQDAVIPPGKPEATVKQDGSLGISYELDGRLRWATRGSFTSEQAAAAQRIWDTKYAQRYSEVTTQVPSLFGGLTLLVEVIHPSSRVVVNYDFADLVLIGAIDTRTGHDYGHKSLVAFADTLHMRVTSLVEGGLSEMLAIAGTLTANEEGFVLRWPDGYRLKVKGDRYLEVHRILYGISAKQKVRSWADGTLDDLLRQLPEEFRGEVEKTAKVCDDALALHKDAIQLLHELVPKTSRKDSALWIVANAPAPVRPFLFVMLDGKDVDRAIKEYIFKNYQDYVSEPPQALEA